jgi:magnesium-transporting ATPase (P-type)
MVFVVDSASVLRDGEVKHIAVADIVPGDIIKITTGVKVPADARVIWQQGMCAFVFVLFHRSVP